MVRIRLTRPFWENLSLSLIALIVSLGIGELIVRCCVSVRNVGPAFTVYHPLYGKMLKKSFSCQRITPEFTMKLTTNSDGFRGQAPEPSSHRSILFLGDSFTMGYGVNDGEEFPALVRKALNERSPDSAPVINAGIGDNGNGRWVKFLRVEGKKYNPGLVVLQIHDNDFRDNIREQLFELSPEGKLRERPLPSPGARWSIQSVVENVPGLAYSYLIGFVRQIYWDRYSRRSDYDSDNRHINQYRTMLEDHLLISILEEVMTICKRERWEILAVVVDISGNRLTELKKFFLARNVSMIVIPAKKERPDLYYKVDGHWNALGHRFTADRIIEHLKGLSPNL